MSDVTVYRIIPDKDGNVPSALELRQKLKRQPFNKVENVEVNHVGNWRNLKLFEHAQE